MRQREHCEHDSTYEGNRYLVRGWEGVAFRVDGWELEPIGIYFCADCGRVDAERNRGGGYNIEPGSDECEHTNYYPSDEPEYERTGQLLVVMVGDDRRHRVDPEDLTELGDLDYCHVCGQIGCVHDGLDRSDD